MKVFLVEWHEYNDSEEALLSGKQGVYTTENLAVIAGENFVGDDDPEYTTYTIMEMEVND